MIWTCFSQSQALPTSAGETTPRTHRKSGAAGHVVLVRDRFFHGTTITAGQSRASTVKAKEFHDMRGFWEMRMTWVLRHNATARASLIAALALSMTVGCAGANAADELSEKSIQSFMDYAWSLVPQQFTKPDGKTITVDKKKKEEVMVPVDVAREVIRVGRLSAHAQICELLEDQVKNYNSLMRREIEKKKWTDQQTLYISQLHLTTVMLLTGKIKLVENQGDKQVVVEEGKDVYQTCTAEQKKVVKDKIEAYVKAGPALNIPAAAPPAAAAPAAAPAAPAGKK